MAQVLWFEQTRLDDLPMVGGKNASLEEMYQALTGKGVKIPNEFAVTADAYWHYGADQHQDDDPVLPDHCRRGESARHHS
jgi:phosphoenolpyruvate synthase/pyruvate phosphate dikinase